jgi:hypothetical protein
VGQWAEKEWERLALQAKAAIEGQRTDLKRVEIAINRILLADDLKTVKRIAKSVLALNKKPKKKSPQDK